MLRVCIHHPLNPEKSKKCMGLRGHLGQWVTQLELPFADDKKMFEQVLHEMTYEGALSHDDGQELYKAVSEKINRQEKLDKEALAEKLFAASTAPINSSDDTPTRRTDTLDLNDPRISEIHIDIKYRD